MIDLEIQFLARLPQVRPLLSRDYSRRRLGSHGWPSDEEMATVSGRHVHALYLGVPGSAVGDGEVGWEGSRFTMSFAHCYSGVMTLFHLCERVGERECRKKTRYFLALDPALLPPTGRFPHSGRFPDIASLRSGSHDAFAHEALLKRALRSGASSSSRLPGFAVLYLAN